MDDEITSMLTPDCGRIDYVRSSIMKTHWAEACACFTTKFVNTPLGHKCDVCVAVNVSGDDLIEHLQWDRSTSGTEALLEQQNLAISETCMEDSKPGNMPGFDLRLYCNTSKRRQCATTSSVTVSLLSSSRKAG
ncbi:hypothetical protein TNCV_3318611 [Trichonephila clavipes]|nr:hypothetical protein TNCV_3318611 [Trichonephila clavipes]